MTQVIAARAKLIAKHHGVLSAARYLKYRGIDLHAARWMLDVAR